MAAEIGRKRLRNVLGYRINVATNYLVSMAIKVVAQVLSRLRFTRAVTKLTAQKKLVDMTQPWYTTFQVIKGPLGGGKRRNGGGGGRGHMFFRRNRRGSVVAERMFGGGGDRIKLTAN